MFTLTTRREAADAGLKRYYTGRPCKRGHDCQRFTTTGVCVQCAAGYAKSFSTRITENMAARAVGNFIYKLHPDDHVAALAYCQGLDLQRGRVPSAPPAPSAAQPVDIDAVRRKVFGPNTAPPVQAGSTLHPDMAAQLRASGLLK
jgi:hypothetical protein